MSSEEHLKEFGKYWADFDFSPYPDIDRNALKEKLDEIVAKGVVKNYKAFIAKHCQDAKAKDSPKEEIPEVYVFRSLRQCTKVVRSSRYISIDDGHGGTRRITDPNQPTIKCQFNDKTFILNKGFAESHGMAIKDIYEIIIRHDDYDKDFTCVSGPGVKINKEMIKRLKAGEDYYEVKPEHFKVRQGTM